MLVVWHSNIFALGRCLEHVLDLAQMLIFTNKCLKEVPNKIVMIVVMIFA
jgi:hypothetical protein